MQRERKPSSRVPVRQLRVTPLQQPSSGIQYGLPHRFSALSADAARGHRSRGMCKVALSHTKRRMALGASLSAIRRLAARNRSILRCCSTIAYLTEFAPSLYLRTVASTGVHRLLARRLHQKDPQPSRRPYYLQRAMQRTNSDLMRRSEQYKSLLRSLEQGGTAHASTTFRGAPLAQRVAVSFITQVMQR